MKIEYISIPPKYDLCKWKFLSRKMKVGGSVLLMTRNEIRSLGQAFEREGFSGTYRRQKKGWRIWKIKKS